MRIFEHYTRWEDFNAGLYAMWSDDPERHQDLAYETLTDPTICAVAMHRVTQEWPIATAVNLTNTEQNRRAWLGQAAACLAHGCPDFTTKRAWHTMTPNQQDHANRIADATIERWERSEQGAQTLFG